MCLPIIGRAANNRAPRSCHLFKIDLSESFTLLSRAPIIEAVIGVTARAEVAWNESDIPAQFKQRLPEYPNIQSQYRVRQELKFSPDTKPEQSAPEKNWLGLRCESEDKLHIGQFNRDGFVFSRLRPYQKWEQFYQEGLRLWGLYSEVAKPSDIQRIGLRFINRIEFPVEEVNLGDYLENPPETPRGMDIPFDAFMHHNTLSVPGQPYGINVIQTVQPAQGTEPWGVILDIDVFTKEHNINRNSLEDHLIKMRWLKNKTFFGSITSKALEMIK